MTNLLTHNNGKIIWGILDTFSFDTIITIVVSRDGIQTYPLTIVVVVALLAPSDIIELQSLQGKEIFLHHFVCNFVEKMHGYMRLLKNNTPFLWDDQAQRNFDNLKKGNILNYVAPPKLFEIFYALHCRLHYYHWHGFSAGRYKQPRTCDILPQ